MKKLLLISIILFSFTLNVNANTGTTNSSTPKPIKVTVTEKIPGANCVIAEGSSEDSEYSRYDCTIEKGTSGVITILGNVIKWFAYLAGLVGALFIVYNGILYSMGGADQSLQDESKKRIIGTLIGLAILFLSGTILRLLAPWVFV